MELTGPEAHHLGRVMRAEPGDSVEIFDGQGRSAAARVESVQKRVVIIRVLPPVKTVSRPECEVVLAVAVPKGERLSWMIEKVTELGVDRLIPLTTARSIVLPSDQKLHKGEQTVIAACKQSGRDFELTIEPVTPLRNLFEREEFRNAALCVGVPGACRHTTDFQNKSCDARMLLAVIGPEGGLTEEEFEFLIAQGASSVSLSPYVLRVETAAIAFAAWLETIRPRGNPSQL